MKRILLTFVALSLLTGCGLRGPLDRPPPMWGDRTHYDQEQAAERDRKHHRGAQAQSTTTTPPTAATTTTTAAPPPTPAPAPNPQ
ncbi:MAG: lipoprotein [Pseudomonadota bacterium]